MRTGENLRYLFDDCVLDTDRRELRRGSEIVEVAPQVFDLLVHLIRQRGRVVGKDELFATVWQGRIVSESAFFNRVNAARSAIGDSGDRQGLIKTFPRKGLRFIGAVREEAPVAEADAAERHRPQLPLPQRPSIAVLPFANLCGDPEQDSFADGIAEDLITSLSRIRWLFVIARNTTFTYKRRTVDVRQAARELGVRYVLEGSVRRAGKRLRISAQLVDALTCGHHWAEKYDRELGDIFAVQDEIIQSVAFAIEPHLLAAEGLRAQSRSVDDLDAWEVVARAQTHVWRMTEADYDIAIGILERATENHPNHAPARSLLAFALVFAAHMGWIDREEGLRKGGQRAASAVALDDRDPWGHIALGYAAFMERRTAEAIAAFRQAVAINPNSTAAHCHLSHGLAFAGKDREAIEHAQEAIRLSPLDPLMALFRGSIAVAHFTAGRYAEALHHTTEAARLRPGFQGAQRMRCACLALCGRIAEARAHLTIVRRQQPHLSLGWIRASVPYQSPDTMERFLDGMRKAGLEG
jgi:TolB-like protein